MRLALAAETEGRNVGETIPEGWGVAAVGVGLLDCKEVNTRLEWEGVEMEDGESLVRAGRPLRSAEQSWKNACFWRCTERSCVYSEKDVSSTLIISRGAMSLGMLRGLSDTGVANGGVAGVLGANGEDGAGWTTGDDT